MRTEKYQSEYIYIYNASVLHDRLCNNDKLDVEWANEFAADYFALTHKDNYSKEEKEEFMNGWYDYFYHMFD